jgi:hypothetical protein
VGKNRSRGAGSYKRERPKRPPYERVLIVCEGSKTEPNYFDEIRQRFRLPTAHVHVTRGDGTECLQVVETAIALFKESRDFERVYAVFDRDEHRTYANAIAKVESYKEKLKNSDGDKVVFEAVASVPCFEVWLLMHFQDVTAWEHRDVIYRKLRAHFPGYEKGLKGSYAHTSANLNDAKARAASVRRQNDRLPGTAIFTEVDKVVDVLNSLIPEPLRV